MKSLSGSGRYRNYDVTTSTPPSPQWSTAATQATTGASLPELGQGRDQGHLAHQDTEVRTHPS